MNEPRPSGPLLNWNLTYVGQFHRPRAPTGGRHADQIRPRAPCFGAGEVRSGCTCAGSAVEGHREGIRPVCRAETARLDAADGRKRVCGAVHSPGSRGGPPLTHFPRGRRGCRSPPFKRSGPLRLSGCQGRSGTGRPARLPAARGRGDQGGGEAEDRRPSSPPRGTALRASEARATVVLMTRPPGNRAEPMRVMASRPCHTWTTYLRLVRCEAIEQSSTPRAPEPVLATAAGPVGCTPRGRIFTAAHPIVVAEHCTSVITTLRPVPAGHVLVARERSSSALRTGEDVVRVRGI